MKLISRTLPSFVAAALTLTLIACDSDASGPGARYDPQDLRGTFTWEFLQQWDDLGALGYPAVELTWEVPTRYAEDPFRVYGRRAGGSYGLIATVTSCSGGVCTYLDTNVAEGQTYDYYVATFDQRDGAELGISEAVRVDVPQRPTVTIPGAARPTALDNAAFLQWEATGADRYIVLTQPEGESLFLIGETDGTSFFDSRAANGTRYTYYLAAVDRDGYVSDLSQPAVVIPRPDFHTDIVYAHDDLPSASGFRFVADEAADPIVSGDHPDAQWRLEEADDQLQIRPLGQTLIDTGTFTTELTCGPGSDATCVDVDAAPASGLNSMPALVEIGQTYVLRVRSVDGQVHYAKLRIQGITSDEGRALIVFDWAYQLVPNEPSLDVR